MILSTAKNIVENLNEPLIIVIIDDPRIKSDADFKRTLLAMEEALDTKNVLDIYYKDLPDTYKENIKTTPSLIGFNGKKDFETPCYFQEGIIINKDD